MTFVILTSGIDLSVGSILALAAMVAIIASKLPQWGLIGIPAGLLAGLGCGAINGALTAGLKLPPFIVTLGTLTAVRGFARLLGNDQTIINSSLPFAFIGEGTFLGIPLLVLIAAAVVVASWFVVWEGVVHVFDLTGHPKAGRLCPSPTADLLAFELEK